MEKDLKDNWHALFDLSRRFTLEITGSPQQPDGIQYAHPARSAGSVPILSGITASSCMPATEMPEDY